jgi:hypothetical protein
MIVVWMLMVRHRVVFTFSMFRFVSFIFDSQCIIPSLFHCQLIMNLLI